MPGDVIAQQEVDFDSAATQLAAYFGNPGHFPDPYPMFRALRDAEPVHWCDVGTWVVLGHPEARDVFRQQVFSRQASAEEFVGRFYPVSASAQEALDTHLAQFVHMDDPNHARVRALVAHAFTPKAVRQWEGVINDAVTQLTDELRDREEFDLLHEFGNRVPSSVICDMLGLPREDHALFEQWTNAWLNTNISDPRADVSEAIAPLEEFRNYLAELVTTRRHSSVRNDDLVTLLLDAEEEGHRLSERELIASLMLLIIGGHETTANLISNGSLTLLQHPEQFQQLRNDPALVDSAIEEFLRFEGPARSQPRICVEDMELGGRTIRAGDRVQVHAGAVNRDGRVFDNPDELDITRTANKHLGFGGGAHFCIGVHVARLEARHAFTAIAQRMGEFELADDVVWRNGHVRALTALPVRRF
jgi:cytochrome P450